MHLPPLPRFNLSGNCRGFLPATTAIFSRKRINLLQLPRFSSAKEDMSHKHHNFLPRKNKPPATTAVFSRERINLPQLPWLSPAKEDTSRKYRGFLPGNAKKSPATTRAFFREGMNLPQLPWLSPAKGGISHNYCGFLPRKKMPLATAAVSSGKREEIPHNYRERINLLQLPRFSPAKE